MYGLAVACLFVLMALVFWTVNFYLIRTSKLLYKEWDITTVTAGDFTANYKISKKAWRFYVDTCKT